MDWGTALLNPFGKHCGSGCQRHASVGKIQSNSRNLIKTHVLVWQMNASQTCIHSSLFFWPINIFFFFFFFFCKANVTSAVKNFLLYVYMSFEIKKWAPSSSANTILVMSSFNKWGVSCVVTTAWYHGVENWAHWGLSVTPHFCGGRG